MTASKLTVLTGEKKRVEQDATLALTRSAAAGDRSAQRALVERLMPKVERTARCLARVGGDADDLVQLSLIQIVRSAGSFRGESSLESWADRVTVMTVAKQLEKRSRRRRIWDRLQPPSTPVSVPLDEQAAQAEIQRRMQTALTRLSDKVRTAVVLYCVLGYSAEETAALTDAGVHTVRGRVRLGIEKLKSAVLKDPVLREWAERGEK